MQAGLKGTPQASLLMSTFGGTQITQLICPKRPSTSAAADTAVDATGTSSPTLVKHGAADKSSGVNGEGVASAAISSGGVNMEEFDTRERGETFMCLSLEVKNMVGVEDALEKFTEKEVIEGYAWDDEVRLHRVPENVSGRGADHAHRLSPLSAS